MKSLVIAVLLLASVASALAPIHTWVRRDGKWLVQIHPEIPIKS